MRWLNTLLVSIGLAASSIACYNDSDTYLTELRDNLNLTNAIIGRFTLYPPEYYKARIGIQKEILKKDPANLDSYDNISVAYDRIGDCENALKWIHEKRKHLANAPALHQYSTEANEGTFLIVRWIRGHKPGDVKDAVEAEKHIAKALKINPDAHFGREFAQLYCIRAMIVSGNAEDWSANFTQNLIFIADKDHIDHKKLRYGIAGMMVLGAAWNLPVFIQAIADLVPEEGQFASLCQAKLRDISKSDERFIGMDLAKQFPIVAQRTTHGNDTSIIYDLIGNGVEFQTKQKGWIESRVRAGKHPDKGDDIWEGYKPVPPIPNEKLANSTFFSRAGTFITFWSMQTLGCCCIIPIIGLWLGVKIIKGRKPTV